MRAYRDFQPTLRVRETLSVSPDGQQLAYVDDATGQFNLAIVPVAGGEPRRLTSYTDATVRDVAWHPDGGSIVFLADACGDENAQVYRIIVAGGGPVPLTNSPTVQYVAADDPFSPDGRLLAYTGNDRVPHDQDVLIHDLASGEVRRIYAGGGRVFAGWWSPDGRRLSAMESRDNSTHIVYLLPIDGSPATRLTPDEVQARHLLGPWLANGSGFLVISNAGREFHGLAVLDAETGKLTWLDTPDWDVEEVALSADGRVLVWTVNVDGASELRGRDLTTGDDLPMPALPMGEAAGLTISRDGRRVLLRLVTPTRPPNIAVVDLADGRLRWLTDAAPAVAGPADLVEPTLVHVPARDERRIPAYLYRSADAIGPVGVVLAIHGGPNYQERPRYEFEGFYQYLVANGVAVIAPNIRGSQGYGISYQELIYRDWGRVDLEDWEDVTRWLHAQDWVDPSRIGLFGGSYGGFGVLSCLARLPELNWAAGVSWCGPSNLVTLAAASPPTWREGVRRILGDYEDDREFLLSRSPVTYADQIRAPLMVLQGANDPRVPQHESDQIVERLRARGVEVRYDVYPDEGHGFMKRENLTSPQHRGRVPTRPPAAAVTAIQGVAAMDDADTSSERTRGPPGRCPIALGVMLKSVLLGSPLLLCCDKVGEQRHGPHDVAEGRDGLLIQVVVGKREAQLGFGILQPEHGRAVGERIDPGAQMRPWI